MIPNKTIEYIVLKLKMLNFTRVNCQLVRKVCILKDHVYDLKLPEIFRFDIISPTSEPPYFIFCYKAPTAIDVAINQLCLGRIGAELSNYDNT